MSSDNADQDLLNDDSDMGNAARRLANRMADTNRAHLNAVAGAVFASHAGAPVADVLAALMTGCDTPLYQPDAATLKPAARAISQGRRFAFV